jgi:glucose-1-phosphate thymidylyltransferase
MKGIILAGGSGSRLYPLTLATSKQLLPVYDKPTIYYPLSTLMLAGIKDILIISTPTDLPAFERLLGDGRKWGLKFSYLEQTAPRGLADAFLIARDFIDGHRCAMILGDNLYYGAGLPRLLKHASKQASGATVFIHHVKNPQPYGVIGFDGTGAPNSLEEKPAQPKSNWVVTGLYFYDEQVCDLARTLKPSARGELEITDLNRLYLEKQQLHVEYLGRGFSWFDTGTHESLLEAAEFIKSIQSRAGLMIGCPEESAFMAGLINVQQLRALAEPLMKSSYGEELMQIADRARVGR